MLKNKAVQDKTNHRWFVRKKSINKQIYENLFFTVSELLTAFPNVTW